VFSCVVPAGLKLGRLGLVVCQRAGKPLRVKTAVEVGLPLQFIENISAKHFSRAHHAVTQISGPGDFAGKAPERGAHWHTNFQAVSLTDRAG
jgi:hypothetical protein